MSNMADECQHTFVGGRKILDVALIVNKVVDNRVLCKLDM